jgi:hypothetical protein
VRALPRKRDRAPAGLVGDWLEGQEKSPNQPPTNSVSGTPGNDSGELVGGHQEAIQPILDYRLELVGCWRGGTGGARATAIALERAQHTGEIRDNPYF